MILNKQILTKAKEFLAYMKNVTKEQHVSQTGIDLIKYFEGLHDGDLSMIGLQPKRCPANIWTEGYGHAMKHPDTGKFLKGAKNKKLAYQLSKVTNEEEAEELLKQDLLKFESIVKKNLKVKLEQHQFDALVSHTYNCGVSDTLYRLINTLPLDSEAIEIWWKTKYITAGGKQLNGLIKRRKVEYNLFKTGKLNLNI